MILTEKEKEKLHKAILSYLKSAGLSSSAEAFEQEAKISGDLGPADLLEKKWSSVVRLQQKVMSLQTEIDTLKEEMAFYGPGKKLSDSNKVSENLPRAPEKFHLLGHREPVTSLTFHPVYSVFASSSEDGSIRVWDYENGNLEKILKGHTATVNSVCFEPNTGTILVSCSADLSIKLWSFETFECTKTLHGHDHNVSCVKFLPAGDFILSCSRDHSIKLWEVSTGFCIKTYLGHNEWVRNLAVNSDGSLFASCSNDESVIVWGLEATQPICLLSGHENVVETVAFANKEAVSLLLTSKNRNPEEEKRGKNPEFVASAGRDKIIRIWDVLSASCMMMIRGHDNWVKTVLFHPSGKYLISCSDDKSIRIWDLASGSSSKKLLDSHSHFILTIALNSRYPLLASGSVDKSIKIWECR
jgi:platelet-activating factor acetylhydrolase IB subunit alpha